MNIILIYMKEDWRSILSLSLTHVFKLFLIGQRKARCFSNAPTYAFLQQCVCITLVKSTLSVYCGKKW